MCYVTLTILSVLFDLTGLMKKAVVKPLVLG